MGNPDNSDKTDAHIQELKQKRRTFKSQCTMFGKYIEKYQDSPKERVKLQERIERMRRQFITFNSIQDELGLIDNFEEAEEERETMTDFFDDIIATATVLLRNAERLTSPPQASYESNSRESPVTTSSPFSLPVNLPKIDLPKFDGRIETWVTFKDAFHTLIHIQPGLSRIQKLHYLKLSLSGRAEDAIAAFTITEENYEAAWRHLSEIYDNKRALVLRHAALLRDTPAMSKLADDEEKRAPKAAKILKRDLYVDDLITGADTYEEAIEIRDGIIDILKRGGLNMRQWASNEPQLLSGLNETQVNQKLLGDSALKTLGVWWDVRGDNILYTVEPIVNDKITKRTILSTIAKIFDPLGLLAPVVITAKILVQRLWQLQLDWDESIPANLHTEWCDFVTQFNMLNKCSFDRRVIQRTSINSKLELHGFCDASERAYGACIYIRSINESGDIKIELLCAKSRVAPLKTISLARLELCGAVLLASLYDTVTKAISHSFHKISFWTDSTIVLNWINKEPSTLKTFVANRVAELQLKTTRSAWKHVKSADNPADLISRGQSPSQFLSDSIWRHGPNWLASDESAWPESKFTITQEIPESRTLTCFATVNRDDTILTRYSCIKKLRRIIAYCLRFRTPNKFKGPLLVEEIRNADERIIKLIQASSFAQEISDLKNGSKLRSTSKLLPLHPFIDERGILRVGGRLQNANIPFDEKHPMLLPKNHHVVDLIVRNAHLEGHHLGINSTLYKIRQRYWITDGKNTVRKIVRQCVRCFRINPPVTKYVMGNLPAARISESRPFTNCGIDYCGPFYIKERRVRNRSRVKIYVAVFICFSTKAVHLEVVSDMTTDAFIAAFKRFISRRGICQNVYSDNGTNFVGANNELLDLHRRLQEDDKVRNFLIDKRVSWHFMPALSPNFGGLWEAAVKSFKHHLKRVVGEELFTYEQFNTFVIEIEAILNSRPLVPLSSDPNDPSALTPAHFLIGTSLTSLPEVDFSETLSNRLSKWQHIQKVKQDFWSRWYKEYIHQLNVRQRWTRGSHEIKEGSLVVLKDDHLPPLQWHLGRIEKVHPGQDKVIRAVTVRTPYGSYRRNVQKLALLPIAESEERITSS